jgi:hypothetical protein
MEPNFVQVEEIFKSARNNFVPASTYPTSKDDLNLKLIDIVKLQASSAALGAPLSRDPQPSQEDTVPSRDVSIDHDSVSPGADLAQTEEVGGEDEEGGDGGDEGEDEEEEEEDLLVQEGEGGAVHSDVLPEQEEDDLADSAEEEEGEVLNTAATGAGANDDLDDIDEDEDW